MKWTLTINDEVVNRVKKLLGTGLSQRKVADSVYISQYTVWQISKGNYDHDRPLSEAFKKDELYKGDRMFI